MSLFMCSKCGCIDNTAWTNYCKWGMENYDFEKGKCKEKPEGPFCSECDPEIGKWHGHFPKVSAKTMLIGNDGFLYAKAELDSGSLDWRMEHRGFKIVGEV